MQVGVLKVECPCSVPHFLSMSISSRQSSRLKERAKPLYDVPKSIAATTPYLCLLARLHGLPILCSKMLKVIPKWSGSKEAFETVNFSKYSPVRKLTFKGSRGVGLQRTGE